MNFLNMHGYGIYIWSAYGVTLFVFGLNLFFAFREKKYVKSLISRLQKQS